MIGRILIFRRAYFNESTFMTVFCQLGHSQDMHWEVLLVVSVCKTNSGLRLLPSARVKKPALDYNLRESYITDFVDGERHSPIEPQQGSWRLCVPQNSD